MNVLITGEESVTVFGNELPLGPVVHSATAYKLAEESMARIAEWKLADLQIEVHFEPDGDVSRLWTAYAKCLTPEQRAEVHSRLPNVPLPVQSS